MVRRLTNPFTPTFGRVPYALAGRDELIDDVMEGLANQPGDPDRAGDVIIDALESEQPPLRLLLGSDAVRIVRGALEARISELDAWAAASARTDFEA